jgi:hypothetical protein
VIGWSGGGRGGGDFGLEFFESFEGAMISAAGGIDAVLKFGEGGGVAGGGFSEGVLLFVGVGALGLVLPHLSFGGAVAAEEPLAVDDLIEVEACFGGVGEVALVVVVDELLEVGEFFEGRTRDLAWMPDLRAFMEETALPVTEVGPVDFCALRRFASIWRRVDIR